MTEEKESLAIKEIIQLVAQDVESGRLSTDESQELSATLASGAKDLPAELKEESEVAQKKEGDIRAQLRDMKLPKKMKLAMFGNSVCRSLLIFDANRLVQEAVLKNPQIQMPEIESFVKNANCPENALRSISNNKTWMKDYPIKLFFVLNPKSPSDLSLKWMTHLRHSDLKRVAQSKNLPQVVATMAKKKIAEGQKH